jgi:hypothetical protein
VNGWLHELGLTVPNMVAGFAGGVVNAFVFKRADAWSIIGSVVVGALTANYLGEPVGKLIGTTQPVAAFLVGMGGMAFVQGLIEGIKGWRPFRTGGSDAQ